jgi:hypothetical protein
MHADKVGARLIYVLSCLNSRARQDVKATVPANAVAVALFGGLEQFVRQDDLSPSPAFVEFDGDEGFLLLLLLLAGSREPLPRPGEDELLGRLGLAEADALLVNVAVGRADLHSVGAAGPHIECGVPRRVLRIIAAHPLL